LKLLIFTHSLSSGGAERVIVNLTNHWADKGWDIVVVTLVPQSDDFYQLHPAVKRMTLDLAWDSPPVCGLVAEPSPYVGAAAGAAPDSTRYCLGDDDRSQRAAGSSDMEAAQSTRHQLRAYPSSELAFGAIWEGLSLIPDAAPWPLPVQEPKVLPESVCPSGRQLLLAVGRLAPQKGFDWLVEAFTNLTQKHPDWDLAILGEGDQRSVLERPAKELGLEQTVHMIGFHADPLPFYAAANLYLHTTIFEAENLSSDQAMAMGLPVVGFDTGIETELLRKVGHGILVSNKDAVALASAAESLLLRPDRGRELGNLGADYCRAKIDFCHAISAFCSSYVRYAGLGGCPAISPD